MRRARVGARNRRRRGTRGSLVRGVQEQELHVELGAVEHSARHRPEQLRVRGVRQDPFHGGRRLSPRADGDDVEDGARMGALDLGREGTREVRVVPQALEF